MGGQTFEPRGKKGADYLSKYKHKFRYIDKHDDAGRILQDQVDDDHHKQQCDTLLVQHIPDEVMLEILHKLPLRTLLMFKCVSKGWLDMISNPRRIDSCLSYRMNHYLLYPDTLYGLFCYSMPPHRDLKFFPLKTYSHRHNLEDVMTLGQNDNNKKYTLKATSCGFLLFTRQIRTQSHYVIYNPHTTREIRTQSHYVIYNPHTKETRVIAIFMMREDENIFSKKKRNYPAAIGFYCDIDRTSPNLAHYTVVFLYQDGETGISNLKICSSPTEVRPRWRDIYTKLNCEFCSSRRYEDGEYFRDSRTPVGFLNGVFYCTSSHPLYCGLIAYDLSPDKLEETHMPLPVATECREVCVCVSSDHRFFCCGLIVKYNDTRDAPKYRDSRTYTLQLSVSKENPRVSDNDFGWQTEYIVELECFVGKLIGFDPRNPRIVFFTTFAWEPYLEDFDNCRWTHDLKCYDFQKQEVTSMGFDSHTSYDFNCQSSLLPCERLPWPVSLHR